MSTIGANKAKLISQLDQRRGLVSVNDILKLLKTYSDLKLEDLKGHLDDSIYNEIDEEILRVPTNPEEKELSDRISTLGNASDEQSINIVLGLIAEFYQKYPSSNFYNVVNETENRVRSKLNGVKEEEEWSKVDKSDYESLRSYMLSHRGSVHLPDIDDLMWQITIGGPLSRGQYEQYLKDWPTGKYKEEAYKALDMFNDWEILKNSKDSESSKIIKIKKYLEDNPQTPFIHDVRKMYDELKMLILSKMVANPTKFDKETVVTLVDEGIFTENEFAERSLITADSWDTLLNLDRDLYPDIQVFQKEDPNIFAPDGCTDVYFFGTPGTGKTCLLMGLAGANGQGYNLNMKVNGGPYASALQQYVYAGITPGRTFGRYVTTINGQIYENNNNKIVNHNINLIEMSGEEFALRIADEEEVSFANMGTGATKLLQNSNRKVFFIVIDCTGDLLEVDFVNEIKDEQGFVIAEQKRRRNVSQLDMLNKFVSLFTLPENQRIMSKVDAIHFVVTKADKLGRDSEREEKVYNLLNSKYCGPVEALKAYCRQTKRINFSTDYSPIAFPFSLGQFYLGDIFSFDRKETMQIVNTLRQMTVGSKERTWFDKVKDIFN